MRLFNIILITLLIFFQYRLWNGNGSLPDLWQLEEKKASQVQENKSLTDRNKALAAEVIDLKQGIEAIEERARIEMGMVQFGEIFFQIIEKNDSPKNQELN